jgi:hypothetical protein
VKAAVIQNATLTTLTTQDWTDSTAVPGDTSLKGMITFGSYATANNTATADGRLTMGASDLTHNGAVSYSQVVNGSVIASANQTNYITNVGNLLVASSVPNVLVKASVTSALTNGARVTYSNIQASQFLINAALVAGSDIGFGNNSVTLTNPTTVISIPHNCGGTPDVIVCQALSGVGALPGGAGIATDITMVYERGGGTTASHTFAYGFKTDPTKTAAYITSAAAATGINVSTGASGNTFTIGNVGATTFDVTLSFDQGSPTQFNVFAMRGTSNPITAKCGLFTTKTSTGTSADITGMTQPPILVMYLPTRLTAAATLATDDTSACMGIGWSANNGGVTQQYCSSIVLPDNVATNQVAFSRTSNNRAGIILDNSGNILTDWQINSWDSGGITHNYNTSSGTAYEVMYVAISSPVAGGATISPTQMMLGVG